MKLSVVVISFNQLAFVRRLTEQLLDQDFPSSDYEIVLVECASTDGTPEWIRGQQDPRLKPLFMTEPSNRSVARNAGISTCSGKIVVMIDGDHTVRRDFLAIHWRAHSQAECAIVGKSDFASHPDFTALNTYLNGGGAAKLPRGARLPGRYFLTRNCSVPRAVLQRIGMFDVQFDKWGGEDLDLGVRIEAAGVPIYGELDALALHHHFRDVKSLMSNVEAYGREGVPRLLSKHPRLFRELNLDHLFKNPFEQDRFHPAHRFIARALCSSLVYHVVLALARLLRRRRLPRIVFDYLHLRQYARGFQHSIEFTTLIVKQDESN